MRLIDADALIDIFEDRLEKIRNRYGDYSGEAGVCAGALRLVRVQPTIEPERKKGRWTERNPQNSDKCRLIECDQCGFSHIVGFNVPYEHWIENRNFCEKCGSAMEGAKQE